MFSLLLQGNPNVVSLLWLRPEGYLVVTKPARLILQNRDLFAGKHVYDAFSGYARQQLTKMETRDPAEPPGLPGIHIRGKISRHSLEQSPLAMKW